MCLDGHQAPPIPSRPIVRKPRPSQPAGFSFLGDAAHVLLRWQGSASYRLILACMLSGVSRDRPVIVGWSTAPRGQVIEESLGNSRRNWQPARACWQGPNHYAPNRARNRVDHRTITGRSWDNFGTLEAYMPL